MALVLLLVIVAIVLGIIGVVAKGLFYLLGHRCGRFGRRLGPARPAPGPPPQALAPVTRSPGQSPRVALPG
ncbi:hypothetical protein ABZY10_40305, partial [Streptomyces sp. NPDC006539]